MRPVGISVSAPLPRLLPERSAPWGCLLLETTQRLNSQWPKAPTPIPRQGLRWVHTPPGYALQTTSSLYARTLRRVLDRCRDVALSQGADPRPVVPWGRGPLPASAGCTFPDLGRHLAMPVIAAVSLDTLLYEWGRLRAWVLAERPLVWATSPGPCAPDQWDRLLAHLLTLPPPTFVRLDGWTADGQRTGLLSDANVFPRSQLYDLLTILPLATPLVFTRPSPGQATLDHYLIRHWDAFTQQVVLPHAPSTHPA